MLALIRYFLFSGVSKLNGGGTYSTAPSFFFTRFRNQVRPIHHRNQ
jgi:hypothetical protein